MATVNVTFDLPVLPDNDVWWANNAAWQAYWNSSSLSIEVDPADTTHYGLVKQAGTLAYATLPTTNNDANVFVVDAVQYSCPTLESFQQLKASHDALNTNYQNLKTAMIAAGLATL